MVTTTAFLTRGSKKQAPTLMIALAEKINMQEPIIRSLYWFGTVVTNSRILPE